MTLKTILMLKLGFLNNQYGVEAIKRQLYLSDKIDHPNICSINDWRINDGYLLLDDELCCSNVSYIVTDFPNFKNLYFYLYNGRHFSEKMAKFFFEQIVEIVDILHKNGFTCLDLHPSNFNLIKDDRILEDRIILKFTGLESWIEFEDDLSINKETNNWQEKQSYVKRDVSLIGELLFLLVIGCKPYKERSNNDALFKLITTDPDLYFKTHPILSNRFIDNSISDDFINLCILLLQSNNGHIISFNEMQNHYWMIKTITPYKYFSVAILENILSESIIH